MSKTKAKSAILKKTDQNAKIKKPYYEERFNKFVTLLSEERLPHWQNIGEALGVTGGTITQWKRHPKAQAAIIKGIEFALQQMETSGKKDWRMWAEKLKMLGVKTKDEQ